jgi:hypothetical protein
LNVNVRVRDEITKRAERGQATIKREYGLTEAERELARATGQSPVAREEILGTLRGLRAHAPGGDPRALANRLVTIIKALRSLPGDRKAALRIARAADDIPKHRAKIDAGLAAARLFYEESNLALLKHMQWAKPTRLPSLAIDSTGKIWPKAA